MTDTVYSQPKALLPRKLEERETLQTLNHWKSVFVNYYRRCQFYGFFLQPGVTWSNEANHGFTTPETNGLKRSVETLSFDLEGFLACLASYLPFDYVSAKLISQTTCMADAWQIVYEIYDAEVCSTHYLDYASMKKKPEETYRNFFNRLVGFVQQHLPTTRLSAEGVNSPPNGEVMSIGLLDSIAIHWLITIDKRLINIVKTEFATQLKTHRLCQIIKHIAPNIDELLIRYNNSDSVASIAQMSATENSLSYNPGPQAVDNIIRRLEKLESQRYSSKKRRIKAKNREQKICSHCAYINRQLGCNLDAQHYLSECPRRKVSVNVIEHSQQLNGESDASETSEGDYHRNETSFKQIPFQTELQQGEVGSASVYECTQLSNSYERTAELPEPDIIASPVSDQLIIDQLYSLNDSNSSDVKSTGQNKSPLSSNKSFSVSLMKLSSSAYGWGEIKKSKSPRIGGCINDVYAPALIDSGAEINVLDADIAIKAGIGIEASTETAQAANKLPLQVYGQTTSPVKFKCNTQEGYKMLNLGFVLVVQNLGVACLIGEPGKEENNIICLPQKKIVILAGGNTAHHTSYLSSETEYVLAKAHMAQSIKPGQCLHYSLPAHMAHISHVLVTPRRETLNWVEPRVMQVIDGAINIPNASPGLVNIKKSSNLADIRGTQLFLNNIEPYLDYPQEDVDNFQFKNRAKHRKMEVSYLDQLQVDPDKVLSDEERMLFHELHKKFEHLFTPQPGRYNGNWGYIENKLKFSTPPPPNSRTYIPNYAPSMNTLLAEKMDLLEDWGVLATPEAVGVSVDFVSPSMLVPKPDSKDYRLVTDFSALNLYLKRVPNTSATIAQARARIARSKFVVHLDFANFFYQNGLQRDDIKFLGTVHPYKGLRVYTCDPQGLKGASERSYEKLLRIFGDLIQNHRLAQMADGLHVLGDTIQELLKNYEEVLTRASACNLTFKPSKVVVCPQKINLFGWRLEGSMWFPTEHTTSALVNAELPLTIKQLRSFLGSYKQLSSCMPNYASTVHILEQLTSNRKSAEKIVWTDCLLQAFQAAKDLAAKPTGIAEPRPDDELYTFSDYAADTRAVGGRLLIRRKLSNGDFVELPGGYFNAILDKHKANWLPCEGEACAIRLVLEHFKHYIRESVHQTVHFTDNQPCVLAWRRSQRGAFSNSARISAFLTGLSSLPVELRHRPGKQMCTSDFASRHPTVCNSQKCQICRFVQEWEAIGDLATNVRATTIEDIKAGRSLMPMSQRNTWKAIQHRDPVHVKLKKLILSQQLPEQRKTRGDYTKIKLLHNQYVKGNLFIDSDGLILLKSPDGKFNGAVITVPPSLFPGIANALHLQLDHPSKPQLTALMSRYFYTPGGKAVIDEVINNCHQCATVKKLPKVLLQDTTTPTQGLAAAFAADVIERNSQKILVIREQLSQFIRAKLISDQTHQTLRDGIIELITDILPTEGATLRVDGATGFQALQKEAETPGTDLYKLKIRIEIGRLLNKNKNPTAEIVNQELLKEILRLTNGPGPITPTQLILVTRNVNSRIRYNGLSPKEIMFRRDVNDNTPLDVHDSDIEQKQMLNRKTSSKATHKFNSKFKSETPPETYDIGDLVLLREGKHKNKPRELYIVEQFEDEFILIRKLSKTLRPRLYRALPMELIKAPISKDYNTTPKAEENFQIGTEQQLRTKSGRPLRKAAMKAHGINTVSAKKALAYGWKSDDQSSDEELHGGFPCVQYLQEPYSSHESLPSSTRSPSPHSNLSSSSDSMDDLPCENNPWDLPLTFTNSNYSPLTSSVQSSQRERLQATSTTPVSSPGSLSAEQNLISSDLESTPQYSSSAPRIPKPASALHIDTLQVNDLSNVLPLPQRTIPQTPPQSTRVFTRSARWRKPINYRSFHLTGKKNEDEEDEMTT